MFTLNNYNISDIYWNPVDFDVIGDQFKLKKTPITFSNGMFFNIFPFLSSVKDLSFNNKSGILLTGLNNNINIIENNSEPKNVSELSIIKSLIAPFGGNPYNLYQIVNGLSGLTVSNTPTPNITEELTFNFVGSQVWIEDYYGSVLTYMGLTDGYLGFTPKAPPYIGSKFPVADNQIWDYLLGDGTIVLFAYNTINTNNPVIVTKNIYNDLECNYFDYSFVKNIPNDAILFLRSYTNKKNNKNSVKNSFTVTYDPSPLLNENNLSIKTKNNSYNQNYLGIFPYEYVKSNGKYDFYFHGLKNYQTTEYRYSTPDDYREYNKIYSGTNQDKGLNKIYLGYQTNTVMLEFPASTETAFYFTPTSDAIPLSTCGFIEDGASAGNYPYIADRIFTSKYTKFDEINELELVINKTDTHDNEFLCSWLYGNKNEGTKIWYDRYYNPAYYTIDQALSSKHMVYHDRLDNNGYVYDVPSQTILAPGVYYTYYHAGNKDSLDFLEDLNYTYTNALSYSNILSVTNWTSSILTDSSPYENNGFSFGNSGGLYGDYWKLDGSNYAIFQADDILLQEDKLTTSIWLNVDDWTNINGYQIFGNYYNSGFGLINESNTIAPLITVVNNNSGKIYNFNYRFGEASVIKSKITNGRIVQKLSDMSYWIFDPISLLGYYYSVDNSLVNTVSITGVSNIDQVETDSQENLYIYDNINKSYVILQKNGTIENGGTLSNFCNRIEIDLYNDTIKTNVYGNCSVIDNDNNLWQIIGPNLYKNNNIISTVGASNQMSCDAYNNIWIIGTDNSYMKLDSNGILQFKYNFSKSVLPIQDDCPVPPPPNPPLLRVLDEDLPFLATTNYVYILTNFFQQILVTEVHRKPKIPKKPVIQRFRSIDFINLPIPLANNNDLTNICGLSAIQNDQMIMVDEYDNEAYLINQLGEPVTKINFEILLSEGESLGFATGGDFTGYQNIRKYWNKKNTTLSWKFKTVDNTGKINLIGLPYDVSTLSKGWHNFTIVFDSNVGATYYIDSIPVQNISFQSYNIPYNISYDTRTSLLLGATTIKNSTLNNILNLNNGYSYIGSVADLRLYNIALSQNDVEELYYSSSFSPRIKSLKWNMKVGYRNYVEEINEWFQFQLPTNKSKYYNINIHNLKIDDNLKSNIELALGNIIGKLSPAHTELNKINWK
jgi:hypothetical protein